MSASRPQSGKPDGRNTGAAPSEDDALVLAAGVSLPSSTRVTPMLRQWLAAKAKAKDAILLFRMGDFYELFGDDARLAGEVLDLNVTTRDRDKGEDAMPMAGFPHPAAPSYIARLIGAGFKVAVCDQMEDPALAKGIVKRDVTRVVTPGMVTDDESLDTKSHNFLVGVVDGQKQDVSDIGARRVPPWVGPDQRRFGVCALDVSTGELFCTVVQGERGLVDELARLGPRELVVDERLLPVPPSGADGGDVLAAPATPSFSEDPQGNPSGPDVSLAARLASILPRTAGGQQRLERREGPHSLRLVPGLGAPDAWLQEAPRKPALLAAELCLRYAEETGQGTLPRHLRPPLGYAVDARLLLDSTTRSHLDLCGPSGDLRRHGTLLWHVDRTRTAAGGRRLLRRLLEPSTSLEVIAAGHDRLQVLVDDGALRDTLQDSLSGMSDIDRLVGRAANGRAGPRELARLGRALERLPTLCAGLFGHEAWAQQITPLADAIESCSLVCERLLRAVADDAPIALGDERAFREGYDDDLDALMLLTGNSQAEIAGLEAREREATGIPSLKVRFNNVFGYFIEVTKTHQAKVPAHYTRKQTIANGERFITDELAGLQEKLEGADGRRRRREAELLFDLKELVAVHAAALLKVSAFAADVDATLSLADVAIADRCVRPTLLPAAERSLSLVDVRHPVVARLCAARGETFVPSTVSLSPERQMLIVTGPNMAGKSTMMRQVALAQLLSQAGAFVPAASATLSVCDRIFTRVGADDDTASGRSTFMVEMTETSHILRGATPESLVLLDEIGRGTSTFDGLAIAWAVAEHLHDEVRARTLFATHYHELCSMSGHLDKLHNVHVAVIERGDSIVFVRTLKDGPAGKSFGIQVARLAGLPTMVVARAREVLSHLEGDPDEVATSTSTSTSPHRRSLPKAMVRRITPQMSLFTGAPDTSSELDADDVDADDLRGPSLTPAVQAVLDALRETDVHRLTPLQAMNTLATLVDKARKV